MSNFERHDDRVSNMEAPASLGFAIDANGNNWANRPDNVINSHMSKVTWPSPDDYWQYRRLLDEHRWFELGEYLEQKEPKLDKDDKIRTVQARAVIAKLMQEKS